MITPDRRAAAERVAAMMLPTFPDAHDAMTAYLLDRPDILDLALAGNLDEENQRYVDECRAVNRVLLAALAGLAEREDA